MLFNKKTAQLSTREQDIMDVLWEAENPLLASEIAKISSLSINTIQAVLKKLMNRQLIEVADIVHSGTVLSRRYRPTVDQKDFAVQQFVGGLKQAEENISTPKIVATLLEYEKDEEKVIEELEKMLDDRKGKLKAKN